MLTELEKEFFKVFGVEPIKYILPLGQNFYWQDGSRIMQEAEYKMFKIIENDLTEEDKKLVKFIYPEITDRRLLQLLCIYNDMQDCIDLCITPCKYEDTKEMTLQVLIDEKTNITDYEKGTYMDVMTKQIQQLFKEKE